MVEARDVGKLCLPYTVSVSGVNLIYCMGPVQSSQRRELRSCLFRLVATVQTACVVVPCVMV